MKKTAIFAAIAAATVLATPAHAGSAEGTIQVKLMVTGVLPDGKIDKVNSVTPAVATALGAAPQTTANDNVVPTVAIEYFVSPNISIETICCLTQHHVTGAGTIAGADVAQHVLVLPATVTLKAHANLGGVKPYVGVGPSVFFYIDERPGATMKALGATSMKFENSLGLALQAGVDIPLNSNGMGFSLDAKRYFMRAKPHFYNAAGAEILSTNHKLDPWVVSAGISYRF